MTDLYIIQATAEAEVIPAAQVETPDDDSAEEETS